MKVLIVDDENRARRVLSTIISDTRDDITQILEASNLIEAVKIIKSQKPKIVFLDVEMPQHSGLEILEFFKGEVIDFQIIFTTAYGQYAIEAFRLSAVDYLLKPIDEDELNKAVNKATKAITEENITHKLENLEKAFQQLSLNKIALEVPKGIIFASHDDILFFEADGVYTKVHLADGKSELICKTLKHFADQLSDKPLFYKPHRSYLINLKFMNEVVKKDGLQVIMKNNKSIPIARDRKEEFMKMVNRVFN
ncbi:LytTR family two component transcriptional regulator [Winogradskyella wandonensis]|uniref:LytTR family two component transcriptional regulator n=1 Tax=Winogradskyella wandonensis TaxID=1442586 RepID=A0A4R1KQN1_9FLAO|nr:LytTR family DNA-binding domain-containing protein [Winogradskyella wandonensis]TCK67344.1 LytTR family two component transcriptional regulator [Winogradskyella wandonensis]